MVDVYKSIRSQGYTNISIGDGTDASAASILGTGTFPTGSKLHYQTGTSLSNAVTYYPGSDNYVALPDAKLASGDATTCSANPGPESSSLNVTLEKLIAIHKGTPCVGTKKTVTGLKGSMDSGTTNEGWGASTLSMGTIGTASADATTVKGVVQASSFYTTNTRLRVAFGDGSIAKYYQCQERYDGSPRNCTQIGTGSYAIQTLGDGRALTFSGLPGYFGNLDFTRVFVERKGYVYYGYQNRAATNLSARLNLTGLNAVAAKLGLPAHDPSVPLALTSRSYAGAYDGNVSKSGSAVGKFQATFNMDGSYTCNKTESGSTSTACTISDLTLSSDSTQATINFEGGGQATLDYYTGAVGGGWTDTSGIYTVTGLRK